MRTVLLITNVDPDGTGGRVGRLRARKRILREFGWEVIVGHVSGTSPIELLQGTVRCVQLVRRHDINVVDSINNPLELHAVGWLTSTTTQTPWVAELLDSIETNTRVKSDRRSRWLRRRFEWFVLHCADRVVWVDGIQIPDGYFESKYPSVPTERYRKIGPIGYDPEKFERINAESFDDFTITYAGSFYDDWIEPYDFLRGLRCFVDRNPSNDLVVRFYGDWDDDHQEAAEELGVNEIVQPQGYVSHEQVISAMKGSDLLLAILGDDPDDELSLLSKTSEYIGARRPILCLVDTSFYLAETMESTGVGISVSPDNPKRIADAIECVYEGRFTYDVDDAVFKRFSIRNRLEDLAEVFETVTEE
jgi:glycosyltransferase involved in cell wall biosynthesis